MQIRGRTAGLPHLALTTQAIVTATYVILRGVDLQPESVVHDILSSFPNQIDALRWSLVCV